jgi:Cation transport ATPase
MTGTLTTGRPVLTEGPEDPAAWSAALALAAVSRHPFSKAVAAAAEARGVSPAEATELREIPGCGVEGRIAGARARLGRADWCGAAEGETSAVWLRLGEAAPVRFSFEEPLKPDAAATVAAFRAGGLSVRLLSGDSPGPVARAPTAAGIKAP